MKPHRLLSLGLMAIGATAGIGPLLRRRAWDEANRTVSIALDYDDVVEAAVRAGLPLGDLLHRLWHAGASHLTLPEDTLGRLLAQGRVAPVIPRQPLVEEPAVGRWTYLAAHEAGLLARLQAELLARQPQLGARLLDDEDRTIVALAGDLPALHHIGLGFDAAVAETIRAAGLQPLPRPTSYAWPTAKTIERTLAQAAELGGPRTPAEGPAVIAFQGRGDPGHVGELVLGHEMLLGATLAALKRHRIAVAYFPVSRHQRGDWFLAKGLAPAVVLAHEFTPAELIREDMVSAAHRWGLLAREQGIRLAILRLFKVVHATAPLDCLAYVAAVADVLINREGMTLNNRPAFRPGRHAHDHGHHRHHGSHHARRPQPETAGLCSDSSGSRNLARERVAVGEAQGEDEEQPTAKTARPTRNTQSLPPLRRDDRALPLVALIPAGAGVLTLADFLDLPASLAAALALAGLAAPLVVQRLDRPASELEASFRPSYAPKLIALGTATLGPLAASLAGRRGLAGLAEALSVQAATAIGLAAAIAEHDYALCIEVVKTGQLDWIVPLAGATAAAMFPGQNQVSRRVMAAAGLTAAGLALSRSGLLDSDPLAMWDREHSAEHTHHLSRLQAAIGDVRMALSPRPLRKWTAATLLVQVVSAQAQGRLADLAGVAATAGSIAFLAGFRQAARPLTRTVADRLPLIKDWRR